MSALDSEPFPRPALIAAGALVAASLVLVGAARLGLIGEDRPESAAPPVAERTITFADAADGGLLVQEDGRLVAQIPAGKDGFVRGVLRGLGRDRTLQGVTERGTYRLTLEQDGQLALTDLQTGRRVELSGFGRDNRAAFADLLAAEPAA